MDAKTFEVILTRRLDKTRQVLGIKAGEYSSPVDRLHNFKAAARHSDRAGETPEQALWGMVLKHFVCILDFVRATEKGDAPSRAVIDEKVGDFINYMILLEALFVERLQGRPDLGEVVGAGGPVLIKTGPFGGVDLSQGGGIVAPQLAPGETVPSKEKASCFSNTVRETLFPSMPPAQNGANVETKA